jgi:hypothetical protein
VSGTSRFCEGPRGEIPRAYSAETEAMVWTATPALGESRQLQKSPRPNATAPPLDSTARQPHARE